MNYVNKVRYKILLSTASFITWCRPSLLAASKIDTNGHQTNNHLYHPTNCSRTRSNLTNPLTQSYLATCSSSLATIPYPVAHTPSIRRIDGQIVSYVIPASLSPPRFRCRYLTRAFFFSFFFWRHYLIPVHFNGRDRLVVGEMLTWREIERWI